jgi:WXG100 family type VII secretion target
MIEIAQGNGYDTPMGEAPKQTFKEGGKGMGTLTRVTTAKLKAASGQIQDQVARYRAEVEGIYACGAELDAMWEGSANETFAAAMGQDRERFEAMAKLLTAYQQGLDASAATYEAAEQRALDAIGAHSAR